jgi:hypothetical protein
MAQSAENTQSSMGVRVRIWLRSGSNVAASVFGPKGPRAAGKMSSLGARRRSSSRHCAVAPGPENSVARKSAVERSR